MKGNPQYFDWHAQSSYSEKTHYCQKIILDLSRRRNRKFLQQGLLHPGHLHTFLRAEKPIIEAPLPRKEVVEPIGCEFCRVALEAVQRENDVREVLRAWALYPRGLGLGSISLSHGYFDVSHSYDTYALEGKHDSKHWIRELTYCGKVIWEQNIRAEDFRT